MIAAAARPRRPSDLTRLLLFDPESNAYADRELSELPRILRAPDILVFNDSATLPAALRPNDTLELRLTGQAPDGSFWAITLGSGDHRQPTERRGPAPTLCVDCEIAFSEQLQARVVEIDPSHPSRVRLAFTQQGAAFWAGLYRSARPIQYAYLRAELELWDIQTPFASVPWSVEMPSAGKPFNWALLSALRRQGLSWAV
ncbi:MAG TPA: S-adenosylmethionine:tRNA ribosyltransferase-isomerase, partial [Polyangiaceae bacterium]|nr:S-adenosylmethionine:tRNA ribosyltransferase-isomerase [Polyangiaceae bacterium]